MSADFNPHFQAAILGTVENQIANDNHPETYQAYKWLLREGRSERDAKSIKSKIAAVEIFEVKNRRATFTICGLPEPWADFPNSLKHRSHFLDG